MSSQTCNWGERIEVSSRAAMEFLKVHTYNFQEYEVMNLLGKGGFASVYKARCLKTHQLVAIKMVLKKTK